MTLSGIAQKDYSEDHQTKQIEYDGNNNPLYIGFAKPGTATSDDEWLILKLTWSGSNVTAIEYAGSAASYDQVWDNRVSLSYG